MIQLTELSKIADSKKERDEAARVLREKELNEKYEKEYQDATFDLEKKLKDAATDGRKSFAVAHFSAFSYNVSDKLHKRRGTHGNYYVAWNKSIFEKDVIECMEGNLKRVYDYLKENNLNPKIQYWTDGGGQDEGFELVIKW